MTAAGSKWDVRFENHPLWAAIDSLKDTLDGLDASSQSELADSLSRIFRVIEVIKQHRDAESPKDLYTNSMLQNMYNSVQNYVVQPVNQYVQNPGSYGAQLVGAADNCDNLCDLLAIWPPLTSRGQAIAAGQAATQYVTASTRALGELQSRTTDASEKLDDITTKVTELKSEIDTYRTNLEEFETETKNRYSEASTQFVEKYDELETTTAENLTAAIETFSNHTESVARTRITDAIEELNDQVQGAVSSIEASKSAVTQNSIEVETLTKDTKNLVVSFTRKAVAEDYQKNAKNKAYAGWFWDIMGFMVGAYPLWQILQHFLGQDNTSETTSTITLARIGISIAAVGIAALCFHRGSVNHKESRRAKRTDLRVRTVHQFIANLDSEVGNAILEGMADRIYLQGILDTEQSDHDDGMLTKYLNRRLERRNADNPETAEA